MSICNHFDYRKPHCLYIHDLARPGAPLFIHFHIVLPRIIRDTWGVSLLSLAYFDLIPKRIACLIVSLLQI